MWPDDDELAQMFWGCLGTLLGIGFIVGVVITSVVVGLVYLFK